jgi:hypothetical protein
MLKFGRVGELFLDKGYAESFDMADSMAKFNFVNLVTKYAGDECRVAFNNMIFMTYEQRIKSAAKAFLLMNEETDDASNRKFIFDLVVGCKSDKYANDERNRLENLAGGYRFGLQQNEYDVPINRDVTAESKLEMFVYNLKTVFCKGAVGNGQFPINEIWVKNNPWNALLASRWKLQYVIDYNATHEYQLKSWDLTPRGSDKFDMIPLGNDILYGVARDARFFDHNIKVWVKVKNAWKLQTIGHKNLVRSGFAKELVQTFFYPDVCMAHKAHRNHSTINVPGDVLLGSRAIYEDLDFVIKKSDKMNESSSTSNHENWIKVNVNRSKAVFRSSSVLPLILFA